MGEPDEGASPEVVWTPHPGSQTLFIDCPIREVLYEGERGPGKTDALLMKFAKHVGCGHGAAWRGVIFRREYKHLDDVVAKSKRWFSQIFPEARWIGSKSDYKWVFPDGEELLFRAMKDPNDYWSYHGHELPFIGWEELTNWPSDDCYEIMKSCNRSSVAGMPRIYAGTANPFGAGHGWVKQYYIDIGPPGTIVTDDEGNKRVRIHGCLIENTHLMESDPGYQKTLEAIKNPQLREAWLHGNWDIVVGGFLQGIWDPKIHVVPSFTPPAEWPRWRAFDWGFARPYSVGWYTMSPKGIIYRYREMYGYGGKANLGSRESPEEVAANIIKEERLEVKAGLEFRRNPADSAMWGSTGLKVDGREITIAELFTKAGVRWQPCKKGPGSRKSGAQVVISRLKQGTFKVTEDCKHFIRTVPILMPDEKDWEDIDTEMEDHVWDELRYSLVSRHKAVVPEQKSTEPEPGSFDWLIKVTEELKKKSRYRSR